jgi:hypothetical protein
MEDPQAAKQKWLISSCFPSLMRLPVSASGAEHRLLSADAPEPKIGCRWQDCPGDYGPSTTIYNRFNRGSRKRFWLKLLEELAAETAGVFVDRVVLTVRKR